MTQLIIGRQQCREVTIDVTRGRIKNGGHGRFDCAIARTFKAATKAEFVNVTSDCISFKHPGTERIQRIPHSKRVREFIAGYDAGERVQPFSFTVRI